MNYKIIESSSHHKTTEDIWILREESINSPNKIDSDQKTSSLNRKTNKFVHYAPFLIEGKSLFK